MKATWSSRRPVLIALAAIITACAASTTASGRTAAGSRGSITTSTHTLQAAVDLEAGLGFREDGANNFKAVPSGTHASVPSKRFYLVATIANRGTDPSKAAIRVEVTSGLKWGTQDADNPSRCSDPPDVVCPLPTDLGAGERTGWEWAVTADAPGSHVVKASLVDPPSSDADSSNNHSEVTLDVQDVGGSGGGDGGSATVKVSSVKLTPALPKAGSVVVAKASVTSGGSPVKPTKVTCAGTLAGKKVTGKSKAATGLATCSYATPKNAKGKKLTGNMTIRAKGKTFIKRFAAVLH